MRNYNDRESQRENAPKWDEDVKFIEVDKKLKRVRLVGPVQDIARHWVIIKADEFADKIAGLERKARKARRPFTRPKDPPGFPVLCPKFHLDRERFIDFIDPETGEGFTAKEVLSGSELARHDIDVPKKSKSARYSKRSLEEKRAIPLDPVVCAMHDDFGKRAEKKTWWHAIDRDAQKRGKDCVGVLGKGGVPITCYIQIDRIANGREMDPADPDHGCDIKVNMDKGLPSQQMWGVTAVVGEAETPLTPAERKLCFGLYKLKSGEKVTFLDIMRLRREDPKALKGIKTIRAAAILPIDELAAPHVSSDTLREAMVQQGYYHPDGTPREELKTKDDDEDKKTWSNADADGDDDDEDGNEDEDTTSARRRKKKSSSSKEDERGYRDENGKRLGIKRKKKTGPSSSSTSGKKTKKKRRSSSSSLLEE